MPVRFGAAAQTRCGPAACGRVNFLKTLRILVRMNTSNIIIRRAGLADARLLADFNCRLAIETEDKQLDADTVLSGVTNGLTRGDEVSYYVAEVDGRVVGQLMLTREWSDWRNGWMAWLQSVYVLHDYRSKGVFRTLLNHAHEAMKSRGDVVNLRLYVEEENSNAVSAYLRRGFKFPGYRVMEMPLD